MQTAGRCCEELNSELRDGQLSQLEMIEQVPHAGLPTCRMRPAYLVRGLREARSAQSIAGQESELWQVVRKNRMEGRCRCVEADCRAIAYHGWHHSALWLSFSLPLAVCSP